MNDLSNDDVFDKLIQSRINSLLDQSQDKESDRYAQELLSKVQKPSNLRESVPTSADENTQKYVRDLMRTCFQVEEEAAKIKGKYGGVLKQSIGTADLFKLPTIQPTQATFGNPKTASIVQSKPLKTEQLSKEEKLLLARSAHNEDQADDAMLALSLLQQYKKDPNFIQKEILDHSWDRTNQFVSLNQCP